MRRSVRYSVSTGVGIAVTMIVSVFAHGESSHSLIILSLPVVY
ncbi:MAG: small multidrug Resistance protein, partial [Haloquadratum sp. J07HQX50]